MRSGLIHLVAGCERDAGRAGSTQMTKPNIILILADDLGCGDISLYDGWVETPRIDALAKQGVTFTDFHSNGSVCSPTRAALLTGRYQQRCGIETVLMPRGNSLLLRPVAIPL